MRLSATPARQKGSTLVLALTLCGLGTLGVVATISIVQARGMEVERANDYTERWARLQNSKALARQVIYKKYTTSDDGPNGIESYTLADGWGEISITGFSGPAMSSTATRSNKTGAVPFESYSQDVDVGIGDGTYLDEYQIQIKSVNPMLSGDLVVLQKPLEAGGPGPEIVGDFRIRGRTLLTDVPAGLAGDTIYSDEVLARADGSVKPLTKASDGTGVTPLNFAYSTRVTSELAATGPALDGRVSVIDNPETEHNAYLSKMVDTGLIAEFDGDVPFAKGLGPDTRPAGSTDAALIALLSTTPLNWSVIASNMIAAAPLSSDVLSALFAANPPAASLQNILTVNAPLPGDILALVEESTILSATQKEEIQLTSPSIARSDGAGNVTIQPASSIPAHIKVTNASRVIFQGESDAAQLTASEGLTGLIVVIQQRVADSNQLATIEFQEQNSRRLIVAVQRETPAEIAMPFSGSSAFPEWRMLMELESTPVDMDVSAVAGLRIDGGIRTDKRLKASGGRVTIRRESDPGDLRTLASRDAWLEEFRK